jgi:hypothetical protein
VLLVAPFRASSTLGCCSFAVFVRFGRLVPLGLSVEVKGARSHLSYPPFMWTTSTLSRSLLSRLSRLVGIIYRDVLSFISLANLVLLAPLSSTGRPLHCCWVLNGPSLSLIHLETLYSGPAPLAPCSAGPCCPGSTSCIVKRLCLRVQGRIARWCE